MENTAENLLPYANKLCKTDAQRNKLSSLFEFKNLYEIVKSAENREYQLNSTDAAKDYFRNYFADVRDIEHFAVAYLDSQLRVIKTETVTDGTVAQAHVYPREIFKEALFINAAAIMIAHNHPSGELDPSPQDMEITNRLKMGMEIMGLRMNDHIIVGGGKAVSLLDMGKILERKTFNDIGKTAIPLRENVKQPESSLRIKEQLASAEKQRSKDMREHTPKKVNNDRDDR